MGCNMPSIYRNINIIIIIIIIIKNNMVIILETGQAGKNLANALFLSLPAIFFYML